MNMYPLIKSSLNSRLIVFYWFEMPSHPAQADFQGQDVLVYPTVKDGISHTRRHMSSLRVEYVCKWQKLNEFPG